MKITLVAPFENIDKMYNIWAYDERHVDFYNEFEKADRCTLCYAIDELKTHLLKSVENAEITISNVKIDGTFNIVLVAEKSNVRDDTYYLIPTEDGIILKGVTRVGALYASYEFLKLQGYRWFEPGKEGTLIPKGLKSLIVPEKELEFKTTAPTARGFTIDGRLNENEDIFRWMARNRLITYNNFPNSTKMQQKLGFIVHDGGHIFTDILHPERYLPSGKTIWEEHEDWFGLPSSGVRSRKWAQWTQFCVTNHDCLDFLSEELIRAITDEWVEAEDIGVWGFDTWGEVCNCEKCKKLGNASDQNLYMASYFRDKINKATASGRIKRKIRMNLSCYEGSDTLFAPVNPIPQNLIDAGDNIGYAPIGRCYEHTLDDNSCSYNSYYNSALQSWVNHSNHIIMMNNEYYNVSKMEDLPLLYTRTMQKDFIHYYNSGISGHTYMHIPMVNWGVRNLTEYVYANLAWDVYADVEKITSEYFNFRYGEFASEMKEIYEIIEEAGRRITSWRAWKDFSALEKMLKWDGAIPTKPLDVDDHFKTPEEFEKDGERSVELYNQALSRLEKVIVNEKRKIYLAGAENMSAVNPQDLMELDFSSATLKHLLDDKRGLIYGRDVYEIMLTVGKYYNALYNKNEELADKLWEEVERLEEKLESYYLPATYSYSILAMISKDALTRTQLIGTITRCRNFRISTNRKIK